MSPALEQRKGGETAFYHCHSRPLPQLEELLYLIPCTAGTTGSSISRIF